MGSGIPSTGSPRPVQNTTPMTPRPAEKAGSTSSPPPGVNPEQSSVGGESSLATGAYGRSAAEPVDPRAQFDQGHSEDSTQQWVLRPNPEASTQTNATPTVERDSASGFRLEGQIRFEQPEQQGPLAPESTTEIDIRGAYASTERVRSSTIDSVSGRESFRQTRESFGADVNVQRNERGTEIEGNVDYQRIRSSGSGVQPGGGRGTSSEDVVSQRLRRN